MATKITEKLAVLSTIDPDNQAAAATVTGDWVKATGFDQFLAVFSAGVMATSATCIFSVQQATASDGTGAKAVKTATTLTQAGTDADKQVLIGIDVSELDLAGGFFWIAPRAVVAVDTVYVSAVLLGIAPTYGVALTGDLSTVDEIL